MAAGKENCCGKVVYEQSDVFVHTSVPASTMYDNIIRGRLQVIEEDEAAYIDWRPTELCPLVEFEVKSYGSGINEYGFVNTKLSTEDSKASTNQERPQAYDYVIRFPATSIHSVRRSDPKLAWSYIVFILKDGTTQPGLHFHNGGITELIRRLQRYIWLFKSSTNPKVYVVETSPRPSTASIDQLHLFNEVSGDSMSKVLNAAYYGTMIGFAKVSQYVLGNIGTHGSMLDRRPKSTSPRSTSPFGTPPRSESPGTANGSFVRMDHDTDHEFEILEDKVPTLAEPVPVQLESPLQPEEWCSFVNEDGSIHDVPALKKRILKGGVHGDIRREVWKCLLGVYSFDSTYAERDELKKRKSEEYYTMLRQWETISEAQEKRFSEFSQRKHLADKDAIRTDRQHPFYQGDGNENIQKLYRILMTYCMYNFDLGYVQGMSDLLSPILLLMEDEVESFWCFAGLMEKEERNFEMVQLYMKSQLTNLFELIKFLYPKFSRYLESKECGNLFFCFKWLLINFKREFSFDDIMILWEVSWVQNYTPHFKLFICVAILEENKDFMMENNYGFNEILKHINEISMQLDIRRILNRTMSLILQLQATEDLPQNIHDLVFGAKPVSNSVPGIEIAVHSNVDVLDSQENMEVQYGEDSTAQFVSRQGTSSGTSRIADQTVELKTDSSAVF